MRRRTQRIPRRSTRRGRRIRRGINVVLGVVVAGTLVGPATSGRAQELPASLGGFQGRGAASGLYVSYNPEGLLPLPPLVDVGLPDALATIASGPATFARASVLDPGDLVANPGAVLAALSPDVPAIPAYPFRVVANSGSSPSAESNPGPGLNARVDATEEGSTAQATFAAVDAPGLATIGSLSAKATTETDGSRVKVTSRTQLGNIDILGLIKIGGLVTDLVATSDGNETEFEGGTKLVDATLLGMPITIDGDGVNLAPGQPPILAGVLGPLTSSLNDILGSLGLHVTLLPPEEIASATAGQRVSSGLRIEFEFSPQTFPALATLIDALPPIDAPIPGAPSPEDILALAQARHLASIEIGRGIVELQARPGFELDESTPVDIGGSDLPSFDAGTGSFDLPSTPVTGSPTTTGRPSPVGTTEDAGFPTGSGVGALILLALLAHPFIGELVARFCSAVLAGTSSEHCSWEER